MAINTFPAVASPVKSVQRGSAAGAGTVTITAVDISKSFVNVFGTASSGTVAVSGNVAAANGNVAAGNDVMRTETNYTSSLRVVGGFNNQFGRLDVTAKAVAMNASALSGGSTNLVSAVVQGYLSNSTSLVVSGACRWEVVEFN